MRSTGNEKSRVTVMLTCLSDGTKLPAYLILKRKTIPKDPCQLALLCVYRRGLDGHGIGG
ncbi:Uncharacterized protein FKW44_017131 [Caligus rogercresseyi]|uniref:Uncharacterized protein n=1 Tax=Caligus rogercresseyi TaxID=217165 RepID=A0A7T8H343_CALRO|nr:Uncharacterized protein FKW44_017131 [Caligus rogercresseyi]